MVRYRVIEKWYEGDKWYFVEKGTPTFYGIKWIELDYFGTFEEAHAYAHKDANKQPDGTVVKITEIEVNNEQQ